MTDLDLPTLGRIAYLAAQTIRDPGDETPLTAEERAAVEAFLAAWSPAVAVEVVRRLEAAEARTRPR